MIIGKQSPKNTNRIVFTVLLEFVLIIVSVGALCTFSTPTPAPTTATVTAAPPPSNGGDMPAWLNVYFTNPNPPDNLGNGVDQQVQPVIASAASTIDVTSFDLNLPSLVNALADASHRGVKVRVVYDGTNGVQDLNNAATGNKPFKAIDVLKSAGVGLVDGGRSNGLMHNKMIIIDSKILFMGSWNLSYNDTYRNNNNLLKITSPTLIANYQAKFNELFVDKHFGTHAVVKAITPSLTIGGVQVENYFAPTDQVMAKLVQYVQGAKKSIHFMIFTYTDQDLANAMIAQAGSGLDVQGVIENRGASQGAFVPIYCAKLPVKLDGNPYTMHHKVIIIDNSFVITGSFNFTVSADTVNDDNLLVIHSPAVAAAYESEYQKIKGQATDAKPDEIKCK